MNDLERYIQQELMVDTHEHLGSEAEYVANGPDVLSDLFDNYAKFDLISAGATTEAVASLVDSTNPDIAERWNPIRRVWDHCQFTGFGEAVRWIAKTVYQMDEITLKGIEAGAAVNLRRRQPGERLRILREEGRLDHVQIDAFSWACPADRSGTDFFLYDLSWRDFCAGRFDIDRLQNETGDELTDLASLRRAMAVLFAQHGTNAIAVKSQHAYDRAPTWRLRPFSTATSGGSRSRWKKSSVWGIGAGLGAWNSPSSFACPSSCTPATMHSIIECRSSVSSPGI